MERKLVTIRTVDSLSPIEGADLIELCHIDGWQCIVKKGTFKAEDKGVYFEIDSFLPIHPRYEFLRKNCYKNVKGLGEGFRIKTMKLRGEISQGLFLPLKDFDFYEESEYVWKYTNEAGNRYYIDPTIDQDLSEILGVIKYDPPVPENLAGKVRGNFPSRIRKTDEERIQNLKKYFDKEIKGYTFEASEKLDGSSITVYYDLGRVGVCSRNLDLDLDQEGNSFVDAAKESGLLDALKELKLNIAIQGELIAPGIQKGRYNVPRTIFVFNIFDIDSQKYLNTTERMKIFDMLIECGVKISHVPILGPITIKESMDIQYLIDAADGNSLVNEKVLREGLVFKRSDGQYSFKAISNKWIIKNEE